MHPALELFRQIMALKGSRQVTVASHYLGARKYDVSEEGVIGYAPSHRDALLEHLEEAIDDEGGVVVRQFQAKRFWRRRPAALSWCRSNISSAFAQAGADGLA
jgi:hypothetical protein